MSIKNKIHHTVYFLLFGIIIGILRWTICIVDTNGGMNFTPFLQAFLLIITLLLFVIWDIVLHKITLRVISTIILLCFNIWSYTYYFKIEELKEYCSMLYGITANERMFRFTKSFMEREMVRGIKETGVRRIRLHDLRHPYVKPTTKKFITFFEVFRAAS